MTKKMLFVVVVSAVTTTVAAFGAMSSQKAAGPRPNSRNAEGALLFPLPDPCKPPCGR